MGAEIACSATVNGVAAQGKALIETDFVVFRSASARIKLAYATLQHVDADDQRLSLAGPEGELTLEVGPSARRFADKIRNPKSLTDKLGIESSSRFALCGAFNTDFLKLLEERDLRPVEPNSNELDLLLILVDSREQLEGLAALKSRIKPDGGIWIVSAKGNNAPLKDTDVIAAGRAAGLVDTKVCSFSPTHTALKFVLPKTAR